MYSQDSIDLLVTQDCSFRSMKRKVDTLHFAELLMTSGVVLSWQRQMALISQVSLSVSLFALGAGSRRFLHYFCSPLGLLLFTSSYKVEMITIAHISSFQKTLWSSCWFISHSIRLCPVAVRGYMPSGKMEGGKDRRLGHLFLSFKWLTWSFLGTQKPHSPWEVFFSATLRCLWDLSPPARKLNPGHSESC